MKKFFAMMMCVIMVFGLVACDSNPGASIPEGGVFTQPEETTVMSREDAVKTVEKYYKKVGVDNEDPMVVYSDDVKDANVAVIVIDSSRREEQYQVNKLYHFLTGFQSRKLGLVFFDSRPHVEFPIYLTNASDDNKFQDSIKLIRDDIWDDGSAMLDAVIVGLKMLADAQEYVPSATLNLVLISSGGPDTSHSISKAEKVVQLANGLGVRIHTVAYAVTNNEQDETLRKIAESTGGEYLEVGTGTLLSEVDAIVKAWQ